MNPTLQHRRPIQDFFPQPLPAAPHPRIAGYIPPMATVNPDEPVTSQDDPPMARHCRVELSITRSETIFISIEGSTHNLCRDAEAGDSHTPRSQQTRQPDGPLLPGYRLSHVPERSNR